MLENLLFDLPHIVWDKPKTMVYISKTQSWKYYQLYGELFTHQIQKCTDNN